MLRSSPNASGKKTLVITRYRYFPQTAVPIDFFELNLLNFKKNSTPGNQGGKCFLSIGGDNLQFYPIFSIGGDEPRP